MRRSRRKPYFGMALIALVLVVVVLALAVLVSIAAIIALIFFVGGSAALLLVYLLGAAIYRRWDWVALSEGQEGALQG